MKKISNLWTIVVGIIEIGITFAVFNFIYDSFETRVIAILIIIYTTIRTLGLGLGQHLIGMTFGINEEFKRIRRMNPDYIPNEIEDEETIEVKNKMSEVKVKGIINGIIITIMYFIAVFNLLGSL